MSHEQLLKTNQYLENDDDVIAFSSDSICKMARFKDLIKSFIAHDFPNKLIESLKNAGIQSVDIYSSSKGSTKSYKTNNKWLLDGKDCEILQVGSNGWKKGKIRLKLSLEFIPDEPEMNEIESPLDDIRQSINQS